MLLQISAASPLHEHLLDALSPSTKGGKNKVPLITQLTARNMAFALGNA